MADSIVCPSCGTEIEISEALSSRLRAELRKQFESETKRREQEFAKREDTLRQKERALEESTKALQEEIEARLAADRPRLAKEALDKARGDVAIELKDVQTQLSEVQGKLREAQEAELDLRKQRRELEEQQRAFELSVARRIDEERDKIRADAKRQLTEERDLKEAEKDKVIADLKRQIDELKRKSEETSQQLQGEVMELGLVDLLARTFPYDSIEPVPKGVHGGDVLQHVHDGNGLHCGSILWESKRTKSWSDGWLPKLRDDQRAARAQIAVLATVQMPKDVSTFDCIDGVWVTSRACLVGLGAALRLGLIEVAAAKRSIDGRHGKMELLYSYLSGPEFRHRVEGIVESFSTLRHELEAEKRAMLRIWAKREKQLDRAVTNTAGLYGDLSGIIGAALPAIEQLSLPALPGEGDVPDRLEAGDA